MKIDTVLTWVDGSDSKWAEERNKHSNKPKDCAEVRFRDWGTLKYWFRAVEAYAPWINKIHFVTCGHLPEWLNTDHPKLNIVSHADYIPEEYLPTFNINPIELNFHRIKDLSEHFIYFNDDMFINDNVLPEDFFIKGLPCDSAVISPITALSKNFQFGHILLNDMSVINESFNAKKVISSNFFKWFNLKYGRYNIHNVVNSIGRKYFVGFVPFHQPSAMLKSAYEQMWEKEYDILHETSMHKFRDSSDVNQYIMSYYNICKGNFIPRDPKIGRYFDLSDNNEAIYDTIINRKSKLIVINDSENVSDFENQKKLLITAFEKSLPNKSEFEI